MAKTKSIIVLRVSTGNAVKTTIAVAITLVFLKASSAAAMPYIERATNSLVDRMAQNRHDWIDQHTKE